PSEEARSELLLRSSLLRRETMPAQSSTDFLTQPLASVIKRLPARSPEWGGPAKFGDMIQIFRNLVRVTGISRMR
ncbi:MAG: hypothetical protein WAU81_06155, partial [Candidatus Aminicenantales bacterium]